MAQTPFCLSSILTLLLLVHNIGHTVGQAMSPADQQNCMNQCFNTGVNCTSGCGQQEVCPAGWPSSLARRCYTIVVPSTPGFTWPQSSANCQRQNGAQLASVHSQAEQTLLFNLMVNSINPNGMNHGFWIGMQMTRNAAGTVTGAAWSDGSALDFGNPVSGRGQNPWAIGEPVNAGNCVRMMNYGPFRGQWYDAACEQATNLVPTIGYFCKGCPQGWSMFNRRCYRVFANAGQQGGLANFQRLCSMYNSQVVSIHSQAENDFVFNLIMASSPTSWAMAIGLQINRAANGAIQSVSWVDGTPVDFGANVSGGVAPWADAGTGYPPQPDNSPRPAGCTMMWIDSAVPSGNKQPGKWDDIHCTQTALPGTVCKF